MQSTNTAHSQFANDVMTGLGQENKSISSKYFYDEEGDRIFQKIMEMPEYYLTNAEHEILSQQSGSIFNSMEAFSKPFDLIEFGAGDGYKTKVLLSELIQGGADFTYFPVDISDNILKELVEQLNIEFPSLHVHPLNLDYFGALKYMKELNDQRNITLFLGSNIGNFHLDEAASFLRELSDYCRGGDMLLLGVDLKKDEKIINAAYNDPHGITAAFNLNLLKRMNKELGADFKTDQFQHLTYYESESGEVLSFLVSLQQQKVVFNKLNFEVFFNENEKIHTEISRKYDLEELETIARNDNFEVVHHFLDSKKYFTDTLWKVKH